jgi:translation elongation factor EF-G
MKTGPGYQVDSLKVTLTDGSSHLSILMRLFELAARMGYREVAKAGCCYSEPIMKMEDYND